MEVSKKLTSKHALAWVVNCEEQWRAPSAASKGGIVGVSRNQTLPRSTTTTTAAVPHHHRPLPVAFADKPCTWHKWIVDQTDTRGFTTGDDCFASPECVLRDGHLEFKRINSRQQNFSSAIHPQPEHFSCLSRDRRGRIQDRAVT